MNRTGKVPMTLELMSQLNSWETDITFTSVCLVLCYRSVEKMRSPYCRSAGMGARAVGWGVGWLNAGVTSQSYTPLIT